MTDTMYLGEYNGSAKHVADLPAVLARAREGGLVKMMVTGGNLEESIKAIDLAKEHSDLFATVGCHPTRCNEFDEKGEEEYYNSLLKLINDNREHVVAVGEFGLDYDRTKFCSPEVQKKYFVKQLDLCQATQLPLFLHCRAAAADLVEILSDNMDKVKAGGVVHSFDGTAEERDSILKLGFYIGINGCSLKTEENLKVMSEIPVEKLMIETDCPWCDIRPSHAGHKFVKTKFENYPAVDKKKWKEGVVVKGRNEPHNIRQVLEIIAAVKEEDIEELADRIFENTEKVFFPN
eukprot:TRINITY_DN20048_c0_g1_i1.p1 TRINITY_DN20048_c0_g1~~TRINITY_DN20048_c0_g1_i1.p1  ORF type:complete len:319 (+),score=98.71 TRINITY_DN20048_c0_g1_i1:87-959(+)